MKLRPSDWAWITLGLGIVGWDVFCPRGEMLSEASSRYTKAHPLLWGATVVFIAGHLLHIWPRRIDPLDHLPGSVFRLR